MAAFGCIARDLPKDIPKDDVDDFLESVGDNPCFGLAARYDAEQRLSHLALSSDTRALILQFKKKDSRRDFIYSEGQARLSALLSGWHTKFSFSASRIALALHQHNWIPLTNALSMWYRDALLLSFMNNDINCIELDALFTKPPTSVREYYNHLALEAYAACCVAIPYYDRLTQEAASISTDNFSREQLDLLAEIQHSQARQRFLLSTNVCRDQDFSHPDPDTNLWKPFTAIKNAPKGKSNPAALINATAKKEVSNPFISKILTQEIPILRNPFFQHIFGTKTPVSWAAWPTSIAKRTFPSAEPTLPILNDSQKVALDAILSPSSDKRVVMIHAPPGSGATTLAVAAVMTEAFASPSHVIWVATSSKIELATLEEMLASAGLRNHPRIGIPGVNDDYWVIYWGRKQECIILYLLDLSAGYGEPPKGIPPPETLVVIGANEIAIGNYLEVIHQYADSLKKMVFIGDDKQLTPQYGGLVAGLESVFDKEHLRSERIFLDTQYRTPAPIGDFISKHLYEGKLKTVHPIRTNDCCTFIDVRGEEELAAPGYYQNKLEAMEVVTLARSLEQAGRSYKIMTPYRSQCTLIMQLMEEREMEWTNKIFIADFFQKCEDDDIIVSVVRTAGLGFLEDDRRMNVMLTRCRKAMWICASKEFLEGAASGTLVGKLARELGKDRWFRLSPTRSNYEQLPATA